VSVRWPDGAVSHLGILPLDSYHNIDHPQAALFVVGFEGAP
jgi:hypothetical protein